MIDLTDPFPGRVKISLQNNIGWDLFQTTIIAGYKQIADNR